MLFKETVDQSTLELLIDLQKRPYLKGFHLVGGTALALKLGHRKSIDIDLFSNFNFDTGQILENLSSDYPFKLFFSANNTIKGTIDSVQIDILAHRYPLICEPDFVENISILSVEDIVAMKLNAITINGQRVKDFIDIYYLLEVYSLEEMIAFYKKKYSQYNEVNVIKSLCWFKDVELAEWPVLLKNPELEWGTVKKRILKATKNLMNNL